MKKSVCICLAALLLALPLSGCTAGPLVRQGAGVSSIKIGISVYNQYDTFIGTLIDHLYQYAREKESVTDVTLSIHYESAGGNQVTQNSQVEGFIRDRCDIICVNLVDRTDAWAIIDKAEAADIPVLFFNRELVEEDLERWDKLYYVGADAMESGAIQGQIVADLCKADFSKVDRNADGVLQYVMLEGEAGHQDSIVRTESSVSTVQQAGYETQRLEDEIANWNREQAKSWMLDWLQTHGEAIEVVFANNDEMALGAIEALKAAEVGEDAWPAIVGIDGTSFGLEAIASGEMSGTAYNDAYGQARGLVELAFSLVTGADLPGDMELQNGKYIRLPYQRVTAENVEAFLASQGTPSP